MASQGQELKPEQMALVMGLAVCTLLGADYYSLTTQLNFPNLESLIRTLPADDKMGNFMEKMSFKISRKGGLFIRQLPALALFFYPLIKPKSIEETHQKSKKPAYYTRANGQKALVVWIITALILLQLPTILNYLTFSLTSTGNIYAGIYLLLVLTSTCSAYLSSALLTQTNPYPLPTDPEPLNVPDGLVIKVGRGYINIPNPFRGILISGGAGAGKSASLVKPMMNEFIANQNSMLLYDFKYPELTEDALRYAIQHKSPCKFYTIAFHRPEISNRFNPLHPSLILSKEYAREYATALYTNLDPTNKKIDFWGKNTIALLTAVIWYLKIRHPEKCSLPHMINFLLHENYKWIVSTLMDEPDCADDAKTLHAAILEGADKQISATIGSVIIMLVAINSPEMTWVLTGDDFILDVNDKKDPKIVCLGNYTQLQAVFAPALALIMSVATKIMNDTGRQRSAIVIDEAPTLNIPGLDTIPATGRANGLCLIYALQDLSQANRNLGKDTTEVIVSNLGNQFFGNSHNAETNRKVSDMVGKELVIEQGESRDAQGKVTRSKNRQERSVIRPQNVAKLKPGEFIGKTVEARDGYEFFWDRISLIHDPEAQHYKQVRLPQLARFKNIEDQKQQIRANFERVRKEAYEIVESIPNRYAEEEESLDF